jgi:predicted nucleic acid-binding protein
MAQRALILDTGAVLALLRRDHHVRAYLLTALQEGVPVIVPPGVVTQVIGGGPRDAEANRLFHATYISFVGEQIARRAGSLLGEAGLADAIDAQVVAEAARHVPATILTSDPDDIGRLAATVRGVQVRSV